MNNQQLARIGLGLLGVWALASAALTLISIVRFTAASMSPIAIAEVIPVGLLLAITYLLIFHNAQVATAIFPDIEGATDHTTPGIARTLVALTGVMLLVQATPGAVNSILTFLSSGRVDPSLHGPLLRRFIGSLVPIGCGAYLIMRPERLLDFLQRPSPEPTSDPE